MAIGASGGKDSTVLAHVMKTLNERHDYGLELFLLSIDEGITGYRDDSLETVKRNQVQYSLPLKIVSYEELYGWTMDAIVQKIGLKSNCTFCGVFRRQALDRGALLLGVDKIVTGHNADDIAETVLMNVLRGDIARLKRCTSITTGSDGAIPRSKPFKYTYEKEIVMYAYFKKLDYFSTECVYSPNAYRGHARGFLKDLEAVRPSVIVDIIYSGDSLQVRDEVRMPVQGTCKRCGYISSQELCKACILLEGLNRGLPKLGIGKATAANLSEKVKKMTLKDRQKGGVTGGHAYESGVEECADGAAKCTTGCLVKDHNMGALVKGDVDSLVKGFSRDDLASTTADCAVKGACLNDIGRCGGGGACRGDMNKVEEDKDGCSGGCGRGGASQQSGGEMRLQRTSYKPADLDF